MARCQKIKSAKTAKPFYQTDQVHSPSAACPPAELIATTGAGHTLGSLCAQHWFQGPRGQYTVSLCLCLLCWKSAWGEAYLEDVWSTSSSGWLRLVRSRLYLVL